MSIRELTKADLTAVIQIERAIQFSPWTIQTFERCLDANYPAWIVETEQRCVGFIVVSVVFDECHILNLGVDPLHQRQGLGTQLLQHILDWAKNKNCQVIYLEVRASNTAAIHLYQQAKFNHISTRSNYYESELAREDALIFAINI